jgi:hypothetical protein
MYAILRAKSTSQRQIQRGTGLLAAATGIGGLVGLTVGGVILAMGGNSRTVFWVTALFGIFVIAAAVALVPEIDTRTRIPIDFLGMILVGVGMFSVVLGINKGQEWGWGSTEILSLLVGGAVVLVLFCLWELRAKHPMVNLSVIANRRVLPAIVAAAFIGGLAVYTLLTTTGYVQTPAALGYGFGATVLQSVTYLLTYVLLMAVGGAVAQQIISRIGLRWTSAAACFVVALSNFWMAANHSEAWNYHVGLGFCGFAFGVGYASLYAMYLAGARRGESGLVTGAGQLVIGLVGSVGTAIYIAVLTSQLTIVSEQPLIVVPAAAVYSTLWLVPAVFAVAAIILVAIAKKVVFTQELAEHTVLETDETVSVAD